MSVAPRGRGLVFLLTFGAIAVAVLIGQPPGDHKPGEPFLARGYTDIVNHIFVGRKWLTLNLPDVAEADAPVVNLTKESRDIPEVRDFVRESFLKADLRDSAVWRFDGLNVSGVLDNAHRIPMPFAPPGQWFGSLEFRDGGGEALSLIGANQTFRLDQRTDPNTSGQPVDLFASPPPTPVEHAAQLLYLRAHERPVASIFALGTVAVIRVTSPEVNVWIDGRPMQTAAGQASYAKIEAGSQLVLQRRQGGRFARFVLADRTLAMSRPQLLADRLRDPITETFARAFEGAMDTLVGSRNDPALRRMDVTTTLDARLQTSVQLGLESFCDGGRIRMGGKPFGCAATIMDARTGEILALGTYPRLKEHLGDAYERDASKRRLLEINQNFHRLSIGSSAKPLFAAAILDRYPALARLKIHPTGGGDMDSLLGVQLKPPLEEHNLTDLSIITFADFIQRSSNKYAASLMLLAASKDPTTMGSINAGEGYDLDGPRALLPALAFSARPGDEDGTVQLDPPDDFTAAVATPEGSWPATLGALYDLPLYENVTAERSDGPGGLYGGPLYDLKMWRPLLSRLRTNDGFAFRDATISPERERLGMNVIHDFRTDYLNLVIGGARSQWTTVKLAESFARLATGRQVNANIVRAVGRNLTPPPTPEPLPLKPEVRKTLKDAMVLVSQGRGTASSARMQKALAALNALARPAGHVIRLYSKTGTPTIEAYSTSPAGLAVQALAARSALRPGVNGTTLAVATADGGAVLPTDRTSQAAAVRALDASPAARRALADSHVSARAAASYIAAFNNASPGRKREWLIIKNGKIFASDRVPHQPGNGRVYVFVVSEEAAGGGDPIRAYAVAVNVQNNWQGDNVAVEFALGLLENEIPRLMWPDHYQRL